MRWIAPAVGAAVLVLAGGVVVVAQAVGAVVSAIEEAAEEMA